MSFLEGLGPPGLRHFSSLRTSRGQNSCSEKETERCPLSQGLYFLFVHLKQDTNTSETCRNVGTNWEGCDLDEGAGFLPKILEGRTKIGGGKLW